MKINTTWYHISVFYERPKKQNESRKSQRTEGDSGIPIFSDPRSKKNSWVAERLEHAGKKAGQTCESGFLCALTISCACNAQRYLVVLWGNPCYRHKHKDKYMHVHMRNHIKQPT